MEPRPVIRYQSRTLVELEASGRFDNDEKVSTAVSGPIIWCGISISSRYDKAHELELMLDMIAAVPENWRLHLTSIFCDSKATRCFSVDLKGCDLAVAEAIIDKLEAATRGHNGIYVEGVAGISSRDPDWPQFDQLDQSEALDDKVQGEFFAAADAVIELAAKVIGTRLTSLTDRQLLELDHASRQRGDKSGTHPIVQYAINNETEDRRRH